MLDKVWQEFRFLWFTYWQHLWVKTQKHIHRTGPDTNKHVGTGWFAYVWSSTASFDMVSTFQHRWHDYICLCFFKFSGSKQAEGLSQTCLRGGNTLPPCFSHSSRSFMGLDSSRHLCGSSTALCPWAELISSRARAVTFIHREFLTTCCTWKRGWKGLWENRSSR